MEGASVKGKERVVWNTLGLRVCWVPAWGHQGGSWVGAVSS